ncbi:fatty-acid-binding protein 2 isoform X2 [Gossypium australe]|uniref:Fatty-acid-binding protein 2 isoform X2 n=1 Tax=Gossypium australe TaxID=47621 RepID=A0A5B6UIJ3_9ROSI|nr:fatty-acid-binding protein 2 isoform X2 [Gossypium australe]
MDLDGESPCVFPLESFVSNGLGTHLFSHFSSFVDGSLYYSRHLYLPGSLAFREGFSCVSKFAGSLLFWFSSMSTSNLSRDILANNQHGLKSGSCKSSAQVKHIASYKNNLMGFHFACESKGRSATTPVSLHFFGEAEVLRSFPLLSLSVALIPPFDNLCSKILPVPWENTNVQMQERKDRRACEVGHQGYGSPSFLDLNWTQHAVEPRTGIEFPTTLDSVFDRQINSSLASEVLVGTGSIAITIIKIKSLEVYAFGFYIHPFSVCQKLGPKYASIPVNEPNKHNDFYQDLLRENIGMTVRLVVNCNGMKASAVRDEFEKSLRARLVKTNPNTDYHCLSTFGSLFTQDIALPAGTVIDFQQTADGQLVTKIGGNHIGVVQSKDLCRAFFGMYIGDLPVSEQAKENIGQNVANIIRRC